MPEETRKEHKCSHHTRSRWHNFHFSGKLIMCSVFLGLALILVGGLVLVIGIDSEDEKPQNYEEIETKAPMSYVGPAIMGIGGFIVIVGIIMCLVETNVCRRRSADARPLIPDRQEESNPATGPSGVHEHQNQNQRTRKKSSSPRGRKVATKKPHSSKNRTNQKSPSPGSSQPVLSEATKNASKQFLSTSDKFLTPPSSFEKETMTLHSNSRDSENLASTSLLKSFTSSGTSWNASTEFQTPSTSFNGSPLSQENNTQIEEIISPISTLNTLPNNLENVSTTFMTPVGSTDEKFSSLNTPTFEIKAEPVVASDNFIEENEKPYANNESNGIINNALLVNDMDLMSSRGNEHDKVSSETTSKDLDESSDVKIMEGSTNRVVLSVKDTGLKLLNDHDEVPINNSEVSLESFAEHSKNEIRESEINETDPILMVLKSKASEIYPIHRKASNSLLEDEDQMLSPKINIDSVSNKELDKIVTNDNTQSQETEHFADDAYSNPKVDSMIHSIINYNDNEGKSQEESCDFEKKVSQSVECHDTGLQRTINIENLNKLESSEHEIYCDEQLKNITPAIHLNNSGSSSVEKVIETVANKPENSVSEENFLHSDESYISLEKTDAASESALHSDDLQQANYEILANVSDATACEQEIPIEEFSSIKRENIEFKKDAEVVPRTGIS